MNHNAIDGPQPTPLTVNFNGHELTLIPFNGQPTVIARQIGEILGYTREGKGLVELLTSRWADEAVEGEDTIVATGTNLAGVKAMLDSVCNAHRVETDSARNAGPVEGHLGSDRPLVDPRAPSVLLLTMSGLDLVLMKSEKPEGKAFRKWLRREVLPAWRAHALPPAPPPPAAPPPPPRVARPLIEERPSVRWNLSHVTPEENAASRQRRGTEQPRPVSPREMAIGQTLCLIRGDRERGDLLSILERILGRMRPVVTGDRETYTVTMAQAVYMVRALDDGQVALARDQIGFAVLDRNRRMPGEGAALAGLIALDLVDLPLDTLAQIMVALPHWRAGRCQPLAGLMEREAG